MEWVVKVLALSINQDVNIIVDLVAQPETEKQDTNETTIGE